MYKEMRSPDPRGWDEWYIIQRRLGIGGFVCLERLYVFGRHFCQGVAQYLLCWGVLQILYLRTPSHSWHAVISWIEDWWSVSRLHQFPLSVTEMQFVVIEEVQSRVG